jgi:hypothetical protein
MRRSFRTFPPRTLFARESFTRRKLDSCRVKRLQEAIKTVNGIATAGGNKAAWFKDTEGNILAVIQAETIK